MLLLLYFVSFLEKIKLKQERVSLKMSLLSGDEIRGKVLIEADAILFIKGVFYWKGEGEVRILVFCPLGRVGRTHKAKGGMKQMLRDQFYSSKFFLMTGVRAYSG